MGEDKNDSSGSRGRPGLSGDGTTAVCKSKHFGVTGPIEHSTNLIYKQQYYFDNAEQFYAPARGQEGNGTWYFRFCGGSADRVVFVPNGGGVDLAGLREEAIAAVEAALPEPEITMNPSEGRPSLVNLETWLWAGGNSLEFPMTFRNVTVGGASATVAIEARPEKVEWKMGDGTTVTCGPEQMVAYDTSISPEAQSTGCSHTYTRSSANQPGAKYTVSATTTWIVTGTSNGLVVIAEEPFTKTSTMELAVAERQTLNR